jgi:uncharacterized SAM-binding protein YcdF (DUF218 family)
LLRAPRGAIRRRAVFVVLSKLLDLAVSPLAWALALIVGAALARRRPARAGALALASAGLLWLCAAAPVANALMAAVERGARPTVREGETYDAVILLSGSVDAAASRLSGRPELESGADRIAAAFELLRDGRARFALLTGRAADVAPPAPGEAALVAGLLARWGIARERLVVEDLARNTRENAAFSARLVVERGWKRLVLVTSAAHAPRALGCFRREGMSPDVWPVDRRAGAPWSGSWLPRAGALLQTTEALRELTGRVVYWAAGWTA